MASHCLAYRTVMGWRVTAAALLALGIGDALAQRELPPEAPTLSVQPGQAGQGGFLLQAAVPANLAGVVCHVEGSYRKVGSEKWVHPGTLAANVSGGASGIEITTALLKNIAPPDAQWRFRVRVASPRGAWSEWTAVSTRSSRVETLPPQTANRRLLRAPAIGGITEAQSPNVRSEASAPPPKLGVVLQARPDYAIALDWKLGLHASAAQAWRFRVENKGPGTPAALLPKSPAA